MVGSWVREEIRKDKLAPLGALLLRGAFSRVRQRLAVADVGGCAPRTSPNRVREAVCVRYRRFDPDRPPPCWGPPTRPGGPCPLPVVPGEKDIPASLEEVLKLWHTPEKLGGAALTPAERAEVIAFLKSL